MSDPVFDKSKFDLGYFLTPKPQDAFKALKYGLTFILIIGLCYLIYRGVEALFPKPQEQNIVVKKGGNAIIIQQAQKKRWLVPFAEPYVGIRTDTKGEGRLEAGGRLGCRIEF